jgi:hypothetical protein
VPFSISDSSAKKLKDLAAGKMGYSTTQIGDLVAATI